MPKVKHALLGILDACEAIVTYTDGFASGEQLFRSRVHFDAVLMNFVIIGEMVDKIPNAFKNEHPEIDWKAIKGLRNIIAHDYFGVDADEIWQIIKSQISRLRFEVKRIAE
jgi:uncharacterized protein with HEPN domain